MKEIPPLTHPQQLFLQRILASHTLTDAATQKIWDEIHTTTGERRSPCPSLKDTLSVINQSLKPGFNLEIRSISLALKRDEGNTSRGRTNTMYHAIVNCEADHTNSSLTKTPHDLAFIRLILERLIESCSEQDDESEVEDQEDQEDQTTSSAGKRPRQEKSTSSGQRGMMGCEDYISRMDLINLRTELSGPHKDKLSISQAELVIDKLEEETWLVPAPSRGGIRSPEGRQVRRKDSSGGLQIGPRTYMELSDFLHEIGMDKHRLPQIILY